MFKWDWVWKEERFEDTTCHFGARFHNIDSINLHLMHECFGLADRPPVLNESHTSRSTYRHLDKSTSDLNTFAQPVYLMAMETVHAQRRSNRLSPPFSGWFLAGGADARSVPP